MATEVADSVSLMLQPLRSSAPSSTSTLNGEDEVTADSQVNVDIGHSVSLSGHAISLS